MNNEQQYNTRDNSMKDYYEILGVARDASKDDIREIFLKLAHIYHPDKGGNEKKFKEINEAYAVLSDDRKRAEYDARFKQPIRNYQSSSNPQYAGPVPEPRKPEKIYEASNKIKSPKWNAFFLTDSEVEEYLADGIHIQDGGFLSNFSKERRDDDTRRKKRSNELVRQRIVSISNEYSRHHAVPLEKSIVSAIIEPTKNVLFGRKLSYVFSKPNEDKAQKLLKLIETEKIESGNIVASYPISTIHGTKGVLLITTNGICFIVVREGSEGAILALVSGRALGPIGFGVGFFAGSFIQKYKMNKLQQKLTELAVTYSPCLLARCFPGSQYVPYDMINILTYFDEKKGSANSVISIVYANGRQEFFKVTPDVKLGIIKILSGDNPPKYTQPTRGEGISSTTDQGSETDRVAKTSMKETRNVPNEINKKKKGWFGIEIETSD